VEEQRDGEAADDTVLSIRVISSQVANAGGGAQQ